MVHKVYMRECLCQFFNYIYFNEQRKNSNHIKLRLKLLNFQSQFDLIRFDYFYLVNFIYIFFLVFLEILKHKKESFFSSFFGKFLFRKYSKFS
jgi:hypothetical protein